MNKDAMRGKCYQYAHRRERVEFPEEYEVIYNEITRAIEDMDCPENVRAVMRLRYRYGHRFVYIGEILGFTYQWVYELHKIGIGLLEKHLSV